MKRLNGDDILSELLARLPDKARASVSERVLDAHTVRIELNWNGGGVSLFLGPDDLLVPAAVFGARWIAPALDGAVPAGESLLCLSCGAAKRPGIDLPCGH